MTASEKLRALGPNPESETPVNDEMDARDVLWDALPLIADVVEAAERVELAHQRIIEGVTPGHANATFDDDEAREAAWSEWHASCRALRKPALAALRDALEGGDVT